MKGTSDDTTVDEAASDGNETPVENRGITEELVNSVTHDMNQLMDSILSWAQGGLRFLDRESPKLGQVRAALEHIVAIDRRATEVIQRLRDGLSLGGNESTYRLLCAQTDLDLEVAPAPVVGETRLFFTSAGTQPNVGLDAFDTLCQSEFEAAFGMDTGREFRALIPSTDLAAAARVSDADAIWVRGDGAVLAETTEAFLDGEWDTWPARAADGSTALPDNILYGAVDPRTPGVDASTCYGWSSGLDTDHAQIGTTRFWPGRFQIRQRNCDRPGSIYCAEDVL